MTTIEFCSRELLMDHGTTVDWNNYLREVCAWRLMQDQHAIGGLGMTVEVDESLFVRRKHNVGRCVGEQWVFGGVCRETKECFLIAVKDRTAATLVEAIKKYVRPGSMIISDCWKGYNQFDRAPLDQHFPHLTVNHSENFVDPDTEAHTQTVESMWSSAKRRFKARNGTHRSLLDSYLCEFIWRKKFRNVNPFDKILDDIAAFWPPE
jgi:transposase-like protein